MWTDIFCQSTVVWVHCVPEIKYWSNLTFRYFNIKNNEKCFALKYFICNKMKKKNTILSLTNFIT